MHLEFRHKPQLRAATAIGLCGAFLILFAALAFSAVRKKSATYDEPLHSVAGYVHRVLGDFRINPEDPALFGYWGSLAHGPGALKINKDYKAWDDMIGDFSVNQWTFVWLTLYRTPENDATAFLNRTRFMFVIVGMMLGGLIGWWSWRLAGAAAAVVATAFFALDPNFMAHSALVKNDVMLSLTWAALAMSLWLFGNKGGWLSLAGVALSCAAAVNVKFSGILAGPVVFLVLLVRALLPHQWTVLRYTLKTRAARLAVVPLVCAVVAAVSYAAIWACYGFRFTPTSDPNVLLNPQRILHRAKLNQAFLRARSIDQITEQTIEQQSPGTTAEILLWAQDKRLLPQPWLHGFLYTYATTLRRGSYLCGQLSDRGWWYYFPCAFLFKTPTATLLALIVVGAVAAISLRRNANWWAIACLALPVLVYGLVAMKANLNLGLRHILPVYPFLFIAVGTGLARLIRQLHRLGALATVLLTLGLAAESLAAYPDFLAFFNTPSGGARGGFRLLGDSNLDWGQDLPLLAKWQKQHDDRPLYLAYFGIADPQYHGVKAMHLPPLAGGWPFASSVHIPNGPCYLAVSATNLQGIYIDQNSRRFYSELMLTPPLAVLGGSIYVYELPPRIGVKP